MSTDKEARENQSIPISGHSKVKRILVVICLGCVLLIIASITLWHLFSRGDDSMHDISNTESGSAITPHIKYNDIVYWSHKSGEIYTEVPYGYQDGGKIEGISSNKELKNKESSFGRVGAGIFYSTSNPDAIYLSTHENNGYQLFTSQILRGDIVFYNGKLFGNTAGISNWFTEKPWIDNEFIITDHISCVLYDALPNKACQSNIMNSDQSPIYVNEKEDTIYVEITESTTIYYVKLSFNNLFS